MNKLFCAFGCFVLVACGSGLDEEDVGDTISYGVAEKQEVMAECEFFSDCDEGEFCDEGECEVGCKSHSDCGGLAVCDKNRCVLNRVSDVCVWRPETCGDDEDSDCDGLKDSDDPDCWEEKSDPIPPEVKEEPEEPAEENVVMCSVYLVGCEYHCITSLQYVAMLQQDEGGDCLLRTDAIDACIPLIGCGLVDGQCRFQETQGYLWCLGEYGDEAIQKPDPLDPPEEDEEDADAVCTYGANIVPNGTFEGDVLGSFPALWGKDGLYKDESRFEVVQGGSGKVMRITPSKNTSAYHDVQFKFLPAAGPTAVSHQYKIELDVRALYGQRSIVLGSLMDASPWGDWGGLDDVPVLFGTERERFEYTFTVGEKFDGVRFAIYAGGDATPFEIDNVRIVPILTCE